jgi:hypothetical protein
LEMRIKKYLDDDSKGNPWEVREGVIIFDL